VDEIRYGLSAGGYLRRHTIGNGSRAYRCTRHHSKSPCISAGPNAVGTGLETGDIIRAIDRTALQTTSQFETLVRNLRSGDPVVLQVERRGKLQYLAFEME
jgi:hypothetical protein